MVVVVDAAVVGPFHTGHELRGRGVDPVQGAALRKSQQYVPLQRLEHITGFSGGQAARP